MENQKQIKIFGIIIVLDILLLIICTLSYTKPDGPLKKIPKKTFAKQIALEKPSKIKVQNINPSIISDKTIYLTFDDGPSYLTNEILNILKE